MKNIIVQHVSYLINYCIKDENNIHKNHPKKNLYELMPTKGQIEKLKNNSFKRFDDLIINIDLWMKEFTKKIERLKKNIINEKELIKKLVINYNQSFINYAYYSNFHYLNRYSNKFNNDYFDNFLKCFTFQERTKILFDYFSKEDKSSNIIPKTDYSLRKYNLYSDIILSKISDNYYLKYSKQEKTIEVLKLNTKDDNLINLKQSTRHFAEDIYNISIFDNKDQTYSIYICLSNLATIEIYKFNIVTGILTKSENEIEKNGIIRFKKVIQMNNDLIATADQNKGIDLWTKDKDSPHGFSVLLEIIVSDSITDILSVNNEYFISSHYSTDKINFYDIKSLSIEKSLFNIDCIDNRNSLLLFKNGYILVNCINGIAMISIKTKEVIQDIKNFMGDYEKKEIFLCSNYNVCLMYLDENQDDKGNESDESEESEDEKKIMNIFVLKYIDFSFQLSEKMENIKGNNNLSLMCINNKNIILWGKSMMLIHH